MVIVLLQEVIQKVLVDVAHHHFRVLAKVVFVQALQLLLSRAQVNTESYENEMGVECERRGSDVANSCRPGLTVVW